MLKLACEILGVVTGAVIAEKLWNSLYDACKESVDKDISI